MAKSKSQSEEFDFLYTPISKNQKQAQELWKRCQILFFIGEAGTGKTCAALGMAVRDALSTINKEKQNRYKILLSRPAVACDEKLGFTPGDLNEKMLPWLAPFRDCFGDLSNASWELLEKSIDMETVPVGMLRGRTISAGTLLVDEGQNLTYSQLKSVVTRLGRNAKIVITGDPQQSDIYSYEQSPLLNIANKLSCLDQVGILYFDKSEQLRSGLVSEILELI